MPEKIVTLVPKNETKKKQTKEISNNYQKNNFLE